MTLADLKSMFGSAVRSKRTELGISQEELADRAGLHRTYVSDVERGARNLSLESIDKLARALDLSIWRLFERIGNGMNSERKVEVLLVEDDPRDAELTMHAFKRANFTNPVHLVRDGVEALDFIFAGGSGVLPHDRAPLVILLDLRLPRLSGLDVLRRVKADQRTKHIPVVVLTASRDGADIEECRRLGVETYILKPVDFREFSAITPRLHFQWALMKSGAS